MWKFPPRFVLDPEKLRSTFFRLLIINGVNGNALAFIVDPRAFTTRTTRTFADFFVRKSWRNNEAVEQMARFSWRKKESFDVEGNATFIWSDEIMYVTWLFLEIKNVDHDAIWAFYWWLKRCVHLELHSLYEWNLPGYHIRLLYHFFYQRVD
jgi:hypothetical protein